MKPQGHQCLSWKVVITYIPPFLCKMAVAGAGSVGKSGVPFKRPRGHPRADVQEQVKILFWFWNGLELCVVECKGWQVILPEEQCHPQGSSPNCTIHMETRAGQYLVKVSQTRRRKQHARNEIPGMHLGHLLWQSHFHVNYLKHFIACQEIGCCTLCKNNILRQKKSDNIILLNFKGEIKVTSLWRLPTGKLAKPSP